MIRTGSGEPLILLHGVLGGPAHWREVAPLLAPYHETVALSALGHSGGRAPARRPARIVDVIDETERQMDELGFDTAHIAGNSMGGWMAIELARRGRARTVCALSPAGTWRIGTEEQQHGPRVLKAMVREGQIGRPLRTFAVRFAPMRRHATRMVAEHGNRMAPDHLLTIAAESEQCDLLEELILDRDAIALLDPLPCPITIAWSEADRVLPFEINGVRSRELVPAATQVVLSGIGHVPMFDDPRKVADTILATTGAVVPA
jgi:pimeloyl-ACP methyl ester carboxylesterase